MFLHVILPLATVASAAAVYNGINVQDAITEPKIGETVPQYVLDYAPLIYLHSDEVYKPADIASQLAHTYPTVDRAPVARHKTDSLSLDNLDELNNHGDDNGENVYLTSTKDYTWDQEWLHGVTPNEAGKTENATSCVVIVNDHGDGLVDAFYLYFYAYNRGGSFLGLEFGDHLGDWEHSMIRFQSGEPTTVWYSQHATGTAYTYQTLQKHGKRPIGYAGNGTHATWATQGSHDHTIPGIISPLGLLLDYTNKGPLWDPIQNAYFFKVSYTTPPGESHSPTFTPLLVPSEFSSSSTTSQATQPQPQNWLYYKGHWGDARLPSTHPAQTNLLNLRLIYKYVGGPNGPRFKQLNRPDICERHWFLMFCWVRKTLWLGS